MEQDSREVQKVTESEKSRQSAIGSGPKAGMLTEAQYLDRIRRRFFRTLDYATIAFSMLCIYGSFVTADYLLIGLVEYLFQSR